MNDSKLIRILKTFSKTEMKDFEKFAGFIYYSKEKNCLPLIRLVKKYFPEFDSKELTFENLYKKLYPGKKFNKQVMWNLASAAEKKAEEFILQQEFENSVEKRFFLLKALGKRRLTGHLNKQIIKLRSELEKNKVEREYFLNLAKIEWAETESRLLDDKQYLVPENIRRRGENILIYFLMEISEIVNDQMINLDMYNADQSDSLPVKFAEITELDKIINANGQSYEYSYIALMCHHWLKMTVNSGTDENYRSFKKIFLEHENEFSDSEKFKITSALVSYCLRKVWQGEKKFRREAFELNDYRLRNGVAYYPKGQMPKNIYKQMIINALMLGEMDWTDGFIEKYTPMLQAEQQNPMRSLAKAFLNFYSGRYEAVLESLNKIENLDIRDKTHLKILTAQSYYELGQSESLLSYIDSSKHFLKNNNTVNKERKNSYGNFFNLLNKLIQLKDKPAKEDIMVFRKKVNDTTELNSKKWILAKLDEINTN